MLEDELNRIIQNAITHLSEIVRLDESLRDSYSSLNEIVDEYLHGLSGEDRTYVEAEYDKYRESCYEDPEEAPYKYASIDIVSRWLECDEAKKTSEDVFIDKDGVVYSKDRRKLICFPNTLSIERYEVNPDCKIIDNESFQEEIASYGHSYESMCFDSNSLKEVILPEGLKEVSFAGCRKLEQISIPGSVAIIHEPEEKFNLFSIDVSEQNTVYDSRDCCNAIIETSSNLLLLGCSQTVIPDGVVSIASGAFYTSGIELLVIPSSVHHIGASAFEYCTKLRKLALLPSDLTIDDDKDLFRGCWSLESIELHAKLNRLDYRAFIDLPSLKTIRVSIDCYDFYRRVFSYTPIIRKLEKII